MTTPFNPGELTGRSRGRIAASFFGTKVVMQVEKYRLITNYRYPNAPKQRGSTITAADIETHWVDATADDLTSRSFFRL